MSFKELTIKDYYQTDSDFIPEDFYNVVFPHAIMYKRAVGFFSSSSLKTIGRGLKKFYLNGGKMELLISPKLTEDDYYAICDGLKARDEVVVNRVIEDFDLEHIEDNESCNILAWLIFENRLEIRIVVKEDINSIGMFHDKFSIIEDMEENKISFRGSMNEGEMAFIDNYETIEVDNSWDSGQKRTLQRENQFMLLWGNGANKWNTISFPEAAKKKMIELRQPIQGIERTHTVNEHNKPQIKIPEQIILRKYQNKAVASWLKNNQRGIFEMATGTGKTITSIVAMVKLIEIHKKKKVPCGIIIVVPYKVLLEQWLDNLVIFGIKPITCYEAKNEWHLKFSETVTLYNSDLLHEFAVITTNRTFIDQDFQNILQRIERPYIFCADEIHHMATEKQLGLLPQNATYRIGLSATLMSKYNSTNMNALKDYFGGIVFQFSMKEAIEQGFLTKYYYYPVFVELTDDERQEYYEISRSIFKILMYNDGKFPDDDFGLTALLAKRSRLIASASNKLNKLRMMKSILEDTSFNLIYCGDKIEYNEKFISRVTDIMNKEIGVYTRKFTAGENKKEREDILRLFSNGIIHALTAIRCLDEGIDIPQLRRAFILSSGSNPKEFIQRRGRILRKAPGKVVAEIFDFIVFPTLNPDDIALLDPEEKAAERKIIKHEYERLQEFASLAENGADALEAFIKQWELYI